MNEEIYLSFSIVTYNNSKIIKKTVMSILENIPSEYTYKMYIIDNYSVDSTIDILKCIDGNIEILKLDSNKGFGSGHNSILQNLYSKYHFIINPDIFIEDEKHIRKIVEYLDLNPDIGMLSPLILNTDLSIQYLCKTNPTIFDLLIRRISPKIMPERQDKYVMKETGYNKTMPIKYASGCFMVFRRELFQKLKGFDDSFFMYLEDADITRRVNQISKAIFYPEARVVHAWERGSYKNIKLSIIMIQSIIIYFNKWGWKII